MKTTLLRALVVAGLVLASRARARDSKASCVWTA